MIQNIYNKAIVFVAIFTLFLTGSTYGQGIEIITSNIHQFSATPLGMIRPIVYNNGQPIDVALRTEVKDGDNNQILSVNTIPFKLKGGTNNLSHLNIVPKNIEYGNSGKANFLKTHSYFPSGLFSICQYLYPVSGGEPFSVNCESIDSDGISDLILVNPGDEEEIEVERPVLLWFHNESFTTLSESDFFKMTVSELKEDQTKFEAIRSNEPVFVKNGVLRHDVPYPVDAKELEKGKKYVWQVQFFSKNILIKESEVWAFKVKEIKPPGENKYTVLKKKLDGGFYTAASNKVFFKFEEAYTGKDFNCVIYDDKRKKVKAKATNEDEENAEENTDKTTINIKSNGYNRFELNLDELDMVQGFYTMELKNSKNETYYLRIYVE